MDGFDQRTTTLDLNGPVLSWVSQPSDVTTSGIATFTGIATATFATQTPANPATNTGTLAYQWYYKVGSATTFGQLANGDIAGLGLTSIAGAATTNLTVYGTSIGSNITLEGLSFFLRPDVTPSAYGTSSPITAGTARSTGNANNELSIDSNTVGLTIKPSLEITTQPTTQIVATGDKATFNVVAGISGYGSQTITYQWAVDGDDATNSDTISGSTSDTFEISSTTIGIQTVNCKLTHTSATNSPLYSDTVNFKVLSPRELIKYEVMADDGTWYTSGEQNLADGAYTVYGDTYNWQSTPSRTLCVYAPEKDIIAKVTMAGAAARSGGLNHGGGGGKGGQSQFYLTLKQNIEYIIKIGTSISPDGDFGGAGGATFLYSGGSIVVVCGGGGAGGRSREGGDGGGVSVVGGDGGGPGSGNGGIRYDVGELPLQGEFPGGSWLGPASGYIGGRVSGCTFGQYWTGQGYSACSNIGTVKFFDNSGSAIDESTDSITRGYKAGLGHRDNGAFVQKSGEAAFGNIDYFPAGGSGAVGGDSCENEESGGGGGSGYSNGDVEIITTGLGGNASQYGFIKFEV